MDWQTEKILNEAKVIILDCETNSLDVEVAKVRVVGARTNKDDRVHCIWAHDFDKLRKAIRKSEHVVTYNGNRFDVPVLMNPVNKLFKYESSIMGKHIDLYDVMIAREATFGVKFLDGFSLDAVCKTLGLSRKQSDFDYKLLYKEYDELTSQEINLIEKYLTQDINITYELYQFMEDMYSPLAAFLPQKDVKRKNYIKSSMGAMTYKIVCHMSGLEPLYSGDDSRNEGYKGGHVFMPTREQTIGNIKVVDFTSAYPHAYMQGNLYTKCNGCTKGDCEFRFTGGTTPDGHVLKLQGKYCTKYGMGVKERVIQKLFLMRLDAKMKIKRDEGDINYLKKLQHALKIVINTIYGISGAPKFLNTYDVDTAADCTRICRFNLIYMHSRLKDFGYECLYGDSVAGDTSIDIHGKGSIKIENLFDNVDYTIGDKEYCILKDIKTPTITDTLHNTIKNVPYIMRHKTSKKMYRVWIGKNKYVDVTEDHSLIGLSNDNKMYEVTPTENCSRLIGQKYFDNVYKFDDIPLNVYQFIGFFLGDGSFEINNDYTARNINIACGLDYDIVYDTYFKPLIDNGWIERVKKHGDKGDCRVYGRISDLIKLLHLVEKSKKRFDLSYMYGMPNNSKCAFLRGLFDSDGTVMGKYRPLIRFSSIHVEFCRQISQLLKEVGIHSTIFVENNPNYYESKCSNTYSAHVNITSKADFRDTVGFNISRKQKRLENVVNGNRHTSDIVKLSVTKIEEIQYDDYVYDIEVQDTHNFFANGILVHNTDSIFLNCDEDITDDILQGHLDTVLKNLKSIYPFPQDTFKIDIEYSLKFVGFFKDEFGFKKKRYVMVFEDGSVKAKGLGMVVRRDCSKLSRKIWNDHAQQYIAENMTHKIPSHIIDMWVSDMIEEDITIAGTEFNAKPLNHYNEMSSIHAQISKELGEGKHTLIKNVRGIGIGGGVKYATLKQADKFKVRDLDLTRVFSELSDITANNQTTFDRFKIE